MGHSDRHRSIPGTANQRHHVDPVVNAPTSGRTDGRSCLTIDPRDRRAIDLFSLVTHMHVFAEPKLRSVVKEIGFNKDLFNTS
jgi:hypothetical protein